MVEMNKKIVLAGGTGFVGQYFQQKFWKKGYDVKIISRQTPYISWDNHEKIIESLENADMLINLAGKSVNCRYHARNKREILQRSEERRVGKERDAQRGRKQSSK